MSSNGAVDNLQELGRQFRQRADEARSEVVKQLQNAAETIRKEAAESALGDDEKKAVAGIAGGLERAASYMNSRSLDQMGEDATAMLRKRPWRVVIVTLIVGLIIGWIIANSSD